MRPDGDADGIGHTRERRDLCVHDHVERPKRREERGREGRASIMGWDAVYSVWCMGWGSRCCALCPGTCVANRQLCVAETDGHHLGICYHDGERGADPLSYAIYYDARERNGSGRGEAYSCTRVTRGGRCRGWIQRLSWVDGREGFGARGRLLDRVYVCGNVNNRRRRTT